MSQPYTAPANLPAVGQTDDSPEVKLETYRRLFTEARNMTQVTRQNAKLYRRYYDNKQYDERTLRRIRGRNEPTFSINRIRPGIEGMIGVVEKGKTDPQAWPRNPQDQDAAEVATDCLRYASDMNRWDQNKLKVFRNMCVEGTAAVITEVDAKYEVRIRRWRYEEFFYDPYSREPDFSDASYMGGAKWQYVDEIISSYPEHEGQLRNACSGAVETDWMDRPDQAQTMWSDSKRKRLLLVEIYKRERGVWLRCCFVGSLKLEEGPSPYLDNDGQPMNPIEAASVFVDDENNRYGMVEDMIGPQDEINTYRRKGAWYSTFRQLQETDPSSAGIDPDEARKEAMRPDGVIPSGWNLVSNTDKFGMDMQLLAEAKGEIERMGPAPSILGRANASASGRSDLIKQQAGLTELAHLFAGLEDLELRIMRQVWQRIRQYWTEPKYLRVTNQEQAMKFVQINEPQFGPPAPVIDPATGLPKYDPTTRQIVMAPQFLGMKNTVAEMDVDIVIDTTPDTANVAQEQFQALADLIKAGVSIPPKALIQSSSLPKKREIMDMLDAPQQPDPAKIKAEELESRKVMSEIDKNMATADNQRAQAVKNQAGALATPFNAPFSSQELSGNQIPDATGGPPSLNALSGASAAPPSQVQPAAGVPGVS